MLASVQPAMAAPPIRILPLGDSITYGSSSPGGYRLPLYYLLTRAGFHVDFVGTMKDNSAPTLLDPDHEGHSGWRIDQIDAVIESVFAQIADPDVILLLIGTNDYGQNNDTAHATNRLDALVTRMATHRPYAKIIVANLLERGEPHNTRIQTTFNPFLPGLVDRQRALGREVYFDDLRSAVPLADMPDQLHPNQLGYQKMATNWFQMITRHFTPEGSTNPPAIARIHPSASLTNVAVVFSKPVADDAAAADHFTLDGGVAVLGASLDAATQRIVTLHTTPQQPFTLHTLTVNGVCDRTANRLAIDPDSRATFQSMAGRGAPNNVPEAVDYALLYSLDIPTQPSYATNVAYDADRRADIAGFSRVAYYLELQKPGAPMHFIWISCDPFTTNVDWLGVPTASSGAFFQMPITNMNVLSSLPSIVGGTNLTGGNLEFWPGNSSPANLAAVPNASSTAYDWGDGAISGNYGCMQVHNHDARQVLFAFNGWGGAGGPADLGIGNNAGAYADWTTSRNAASFVIKTLQVYVLPSSPPALPPQLTVNPVVANGLLTIRWETQSETTYSVLAKSALDDTPWTKLFGVTVPTNTAVSIDLPATHPAGFYRISTP